MDAWAGEVHDTPEDSSIDFAISVIPGLFLTLYFRAEGGDPISVS